MCRGVFFIEVITLSLCLTIAYAQEPQTIALSNIQICGQDITNLQKLYLTSDDLVGGRVKVTGAVKAETGGIDRVEISINGGVDWEVLTLMGEESWEFSFVPENETEYIVIALAFDMKGTPSEPAGIVLAYRQITHEDLIRYLFESLVIAYNNKNPVKFLVHFDPEQYPGYLTWEEKIKSTFADNERLSLKITIPRIEITGNNAVVTVDWSKRWVKDSFDLGSDAQGTTTVTLVKTGTWKIVSLKDESIFIIEQPSGQEILLEESQGQ